VFSLGELREKSALVKLKRMVAADNAICPGMPAGHGSIRVEATSAVKKIKGVI
jgi:hypothetical protein